MEARALVVGFERAAATAGRLEKVREDRREGPCRVRAAEEARGASMAFERALVRREMAVPGCSFSSCFVERTVGLRSGLVVLGAA